MQRSLRRVPDRGRLIADYREMRQERFNLSRLCRAGAAWRGKDKPPHPIDAGVLGVDAEIQPANRGLELRRSESVWLLLKRCDRQVF